jgi:diguanylate cyclase (GGDEF)-like protein
MLPPPSRYSYGAVDQNEELPTELTLGHQRLAFGEFDEVGEVRDHAEFFLRATGKERHSGDQVNFRVLTETHTAIVSTRFIAEHSGKAGKREIARAFGIKGGDRIALKALLRDMADDGLIAGSRRKLSRPDVLPPVTVIEIVSRDADGEFIARPASWDEQHGPAPRILMTESKREAGPVAGIGDRVLARITALGADADFPYQARTIKRLARAGRHTRNFETRYVHKDGHSVELAWSGVWSEPEQKHFFVGRDMTERKAAEERLRQLAHYDQLTGLPNRVTLRSDLDELLTSAGSNDRATSIAMFDLDGFKDVNDTLGHSTGDRLLQEVAQRLTQVAEGAARVYRLGGDEFVLTIPDCGDPCTIAQVVDSMLRRLAERFEINGHRLFIGASAGIAIAPTDGTDVEDLISNADLALYDAKAAGGRTYRLFLPVLRTKAQARRELDTDLRRAFAEGEFVLYYQPQLRVSDGAVVGAEALLRWQHPERGLLGPAGFIEALTDSPVALEAGRWILQTACASAAAWRARGHALRIGVNLFPAQFHDGTLLEDVEAALLQSGLPAEALELEITENIALGHDDAMLAQLRELRAKGVGLAFDDFGTGYASLSYLTRYPLSRLKIDQSFVKKIHDNSTSEDTAIVRSIIVMAHNLGLEVIAEGVESPAQTAFLQVTKCDEMQGFYYARPLPARELEEFVSSRRLCSQHGSPLQALAG